MTEDDAGAFVAGWIAAWNRRDLAAVLEKFDRLQFTLETFTWDAEQKLLAIHYVAAPNRTRRAVCEAQWFGAGGQITRAAAYSGAVL